MALPHVLLAGGRAVIDEIEKQLQLTTSMVEPSRAALYRYGNVSSSSIWCVQPCAPRKVVALAVRRRWSTGTSDG